MISLILTFDFAVMLNQSHLYNLVVFHESNVNL